MKTKLNELRSDSRAVSPVIGVVLMIAVVVILAAVVGAFATGIFGSQSSAPQASFSYSEDGTLTMESGDSITNGNLYYQIGDGTRTEWGGGSGEESAYVSGDSTSATGTAGEPVKVIWDDGNGNSAVLQTFDSAVSGTT